MVSEKESSASFKLETICSKERGAKARMCALIFAKAISMGLRSGL